MQQGMRYKDRGVRPVVRVRQTRPETREESAVKNLPTCCSIEVHQLRESKLSYHLASVIYRRVALIELECFLCEMNYTGGVVFPRKLSGR